MLRPLVRVVDDEEPVRASVCFLARLAGLDAEGYADGEEFLARNDPERPGCVVLDVRMPGLSGMDLQEEMIRRGLTLPILFLSGHGDIPTAVLAMKRGAVDFLQKPVEPELLQVELKRLTAEHCAQMEKEGVLDRERALWEMLTPREKEAAFWIAEGLLNKVVADRMSVGVETVKKHRTNLLRKLGLRTNVDLRDYLVRNGIERGRGVCSGVGSREESES